MCFPSAWQMTKLELQDLHVPWRVKWKRVWILRSRMGSLIKQRSSTNSLCSMSLSSKLPRLWSAGTMPSERLLLRRKPGRERGPSHTGLLNRRHDGKAKGTCDLHVLAQHSRGFCFCNLLSFSCVVLVLSSPFGCGTFLALFRHNSISPSSRSVIHRQFSLTVLLDCTCTSHRVACKIIALALQWIQPGHLVQIQKSNGNKFIVKTLSSTKSLVCLSRILL